MKKFIFLLFPLMLLAASCLDNKTPRIPTDQNGDEDFAEFMGHFLTDTSFQYQRVAFPIKYPASRFDSLHKIGDTVVLTRENWPLQAPRAENSNEIRQEMTRLGNMVTERLTVLNMFYTEMRYLLRDGKWYLIYYSGLQEL